MIPTVATGPVRDGQNMLTITGFERQLGEGSSCFVLEVGSDARQSMAEARKQSKEIAGFELQGAKHRMVPADENFLRPEEEFACAASRVLRSGLETCPSRSWPLLDHGSVYKSGRHQAVFNVPGDYQRDLLRLHKPTHPQRLLHRLV